MKTFLTLLAAITSLSAYTLVGVHATMKCSLCPPSTGGVPVYSACTNNKNVTNCQYRIRALTLHCYYNDNGSLAGGSHSSCPGNMGTSNICPACK
ncbi:hypothetical protein PAXRUDRAFT_832665 [Paxillus rubicundulus Ve08.2h10]|uniref:Secreted protein n=1 Tax=Paxillus rubicundulus Ve08.2h10 TaxID=930991 RepID=A0A0D0DJA9_9AGAM|nr:hypothetical protein PAXRUDRAFT_835289 [Paxillus rubicundulus Ve08.2h10]KIK81719.1 hypothetical protein PAXRUDRAFT_832665 [Paxillus rubicundulus Ve08.2h10]